MFFTEPTIVYVSELANDVSERQDDGKGMDRHCIQFDVFNFLAAYTQQS